MYLKNLNVLLAAAAVGGPVLAQEQVTHAMIDEKFAEANSPGASLAKELFDAKVMSIPEDGTVAVEVAKLAAISRAAKRSGLVVELQGPGSKLNSALIKIREDLNPSAAIQGSVIDPSVFAPVMPIFY